MNENDARLLVFSLILCICLSRVRSDQTFRSFTLGGLFPVHRTGDKEGTCGRVMDIGIQRLEAMRYVIGEINKDASFWNFTLEAIMLDTCTSDSVAFDRSLRFLDIENCSNTTKRAKVTGVIGASTSSVSSTVSTIFRVYKIPQISYASTSSVFDDLDEYPYFFRVVPSDVFQMQAILNLLKGFNWTYLSTVSSENNDGLYLLKELRDHIGSFGICIETSVIIPRNANGTAYDRALAELLREERAKAVVVLLYRSTFRKLLLAAKKRRIQNGRLLWIAGSSRGNTDGLEKGVEDVADGMIIVEPLKSRHIGFEKYFKSLRPSTHQKINQWFHEFWESQFNCTFDNMKKSKTTCSGEEDLSSSYKPDNSIGMVIDAVNVMAHALRNMCTTEPSVCANWNEPPSGQKLRDYILNVSIDSSRGNGLTVKFDSRRSVPVLYTIHQFQKNSTLKSGGQYVVLGSWSENGLKLSTQPLWTGPDGNKHRMTSICSSPCEVGYERVREKIKNNTCCWICNRCAWNSYVEVHSSTCKVCPYGYLPNDDQTGCIWTELDYFGKNIGSPWVAIPIFFAILGMICAAVMYVIFLVYHNTPVIMAAGRELCHLIFLGVFLCHLFTFLMMAQPTLPGCGLIRVGLGLGLAMCYAAIFTKSNRISRIFNRTLTSTKRPRYVTPNSQLMICLCLVMIELALCGIWILLQPPLVIKLSDRWPAAVVCEMNDASVCLALLSKLALLIMCSVYAYKTRNILGNFSETKHIMYMMCSTCAIWLVFMSTYLTASGEEDYKVKGMLLCVNISVSGTVALVCIFLPKLYTVIFQPHKNVRSQATASTSSIGKIPSVKFIKTSAAYSNDVVPDTDSKNMDKKTDVRNDVTKLKPTG